MDPGHYDMDRKENPRETANVFSKLFFWYTRQAFLKGRNRDLTISDLYRCVPDHRAAARGDILGVSWSQELKQDGGGAASLLRAIIRVYGLKFLIGNIIFCLIDSTIRLSVPLCLEGMINYFSTSQSDVKASEAYLYALGVVGLQLVNTLIVHPFYLWLLVMSMKIRVGASSLMYRKLLRLDLTGGGQASEGLAGYVVNLLTTDAQRLDTAILFLVELVRGPIESAFVVYLMYRQIGVSALFGIAFLLLFIPLQGYLSKLSSNLRLKTTIRTDHRIRLMNEVVQSIEAIKMYAWEEAFAKIIGEARKKEMNVLKQMCWLRAVMMSCVKLNTKVAIFISILAYIFFQNEMTAAKVFVILYYYENLRYTLVDFLPMAITFVLEGYVSVKRVQEFLLLPEVNNEDGVDLLIIDEETKDVYTNGVYEKVKTEPPEKEQLELKTKRVKTDDVLRLEKYSAVWGNSDDTLKTIPALTDINLTIRAGTLTTVVGTVGSGKSTLLQAIMRELTPSSGRIEVDAVIAYAAQEPWLFDASVRQNILFGQEMDMDRYKKVIECCQLQSDLEILHHGDKTVVGERGSSLSGGQRARVSLARCVYQRADLYLLDDPLAAVDAKVAQAIYEKCVRGFLHDSAVVLVTHHAQYARQADNVCVMRAGRIIAQGTFNELQETVPEFEKIAEMDSLEENKQKTAKDEEKNSQQNQLLLKRTISVNSKVSFDANNMDPDYEGEIHNKGSIDNSVYMAYVKSGGSVFSMVALFSLFVLAQIFYASTDVWMKEWVNLEESNNNFYHNITSQDNETSSVIPPEFDTLKNPSNYLQLTRDQCIYIYASLIAVCIFFTWNKLIVFFNTCIKASTSLHDTMFRGVTNAPMWFFHHNPSGRILNRFSRDMGQVDSLLPVTLLDCVGFLLEIASVLVVVCLANWWLLVPTAAVSLLLYMLRALFLGASRELRRIEAIARSQSLNHAAATVSGLTTIRSCGARQRTLAREFDKLQDLHSSATTLVLDTNQAFGSWMDIACCLYLTCVTFSFFLFTNDENRGGNVGLAITQAIGLIGMCQFGMRQTADVENQMTSVERILEYNNLPCEKPTEINEKALKDQHPDLDFDKWPSKGEIVFKDVSLEYEKPPKKEDEEGEKMAEEPAYAIQGVSFRVRPSEKVAVVGRTGAGKSSLITALFRLGKVSGEVTVDHINVEQAGLRAWRSRLCALPQRPALFAATLRDNLDPEGKYSDAQIYAALDQVELRETVAAFPAGLMTKVGDGGGNLSSGQRQLVCLARAALANCAVLVLDEATANVDTETDKHIQATIRSKFTSSTVLTIAHRLNTVMDYDRVIVMDKGRVVESGHPFQLLTSNCDQDAPPRYSHLESTKICTAGDQIDTANSSNEPGSGIFKTLVEQTGAETAALLYKMAVESYQKYKLKLNIGDQE